MKMSRRALAYSVAASAFLGIGAFALVAVWLQKINPALARYEEPHGLTWYMLGSGLAASLLAIAWLLNLKAIKLHGPTN